MEATHPNDHIRKFSWILPLDLLCLHINEKIESNNSVSLPWGRGDRLAMFEDCVYSTVFCGGAVYHGAIVNVAFSRHLWKEYCVEATPSWNILDICWL